MGQRRKGHWEPRSDVDIPVECMTTSPVMTNPMQGFPPNVRLLKGMEIGLPQSTFRTVCDATEQIKQPDNIDMGKKYLWVVIKWLSKEKNTYFTLITRDMMKKLL